MTRPFRRLRRRLFGIAPQEATFARRGFHAASPAAQRRLEHVGRVFLKGYHAALDAGDVAGLGRRLDEVEASFRGFAYEGAAMALALLDGLSLTKASRVEAFLQGAGAPHVYMVHVGMGWALARLRRRPARPLARLDPVLRWLAVDGYGFHEGYFHPGRCVAGRAVPARLDGYARRAFDQGLGRSLWFVDGADVARIPATLAAFPAERRADLWSGVGLAAAYAGGTDAGGLRALCAAADGFRPAMAQGVAFAAKARARAGNAASHTALACEVVCGLLPEDAARLTDEALEGLPPDSEAPAFEVWRRRIQHHFVPGRMVA